MYHVLTRGSKSQSELTKAHPSRPAPIAPHKQQLMGSQRAYGNQALLRMLELSRPAIQPKLVVNQPGDPYEREADRVADQVMRMPDPEVSAAAAAPQVSRKCAECEEEEKLQKKEAGTAEAAAGEAPARVHEVLRSPGQPLDAATRAFFEPRFGQDFSGVRVHTDARAAESARAVDALAYTTGQDIVFQPGQLRPESDAGTKLLAHELTHVVQQRSGPRLIIRRQAAQPAPIVSSPAALPDRTSRQKLRLEVLRDMQTGLKAIFTTVDATLPATTSYTAMTWVRDNIMADTSSELLNAETLLAGAAAHGNQVQNLLERAQLQLYLLPMYANLAALVRSAEIDRLDPNVIVQISAEADRYAQVFFGLTRPELKADALTFLRHKAQGWVTDTQKLIRGLEAQIKRGREAVRTLEKFQKPIDVPLEFFKGLELPPQVLFLNLVVDRAGFGEAHKAQIAALAKSAPQFFNELFWLRDHAAQTRQHMIDPILAQLPGEALKSITAEDIAFFLGRVLRTVEHAGGKVTWAIVTKAILKVAAILTALDSPKWAAHGLGHLATRTAESMMKAIGGPKDPYGILADLNARLESKLPPDQAIALLLELTSPEVKQHLQYLADAGAIVGPNIATILADIEGTGATTAATAAAAQLGLPLLPPAP